MCFYGILIDIYSTFIDKIYLFKIGNKKPPKNGPIKKQKTMKTMKTMKILVYVFIGGLFASWK